ncbi:MAG TPA: response regulator transcription factor [Chloroflexota bacterium]|nr:response regulator transcription factor [Chloroflexota bacterium]
MGRRVLIADDHAVWRHGLKDLLEPAFEVVSEASEGQEAVSKALSARPDVVVMDVNMPGMDGIAAAREIKQSLPEIGVVIISATNNDEQICEAIQAGVSSYIVKDDEPEAMLQAVQNASEGKTYLPPVIAERIFENVKGANPQRRNGNGGGVPLSNREIAVLRLLAIGKRHKEVAQELRISERTVGNHVASIYNKLGIDGRSQAIIYAIKNGLIRV